MTAVYLGLALLAFDIDEEHCAWQIADADQYHRLAWRAASGEEYLIGVMPPEDNPSFSTPLFLQPAVMQYGLDGGGIGHAEALVRCAPAFFAGGNAPGFRFSTVWDPRTQLYLATFDTPYTLEEISKALGRLQEKFVPGVLYYWPRSSRQYFEAQAWPPGAIPLVMSLEERRYVPYALGLNYGRVRMISVDDWPRVHESGALTRQDIVVLQEAPVDFDVRVAGAITCMPQGPLSHVNLICLQENTPNAYVAGAWDLLAPYADKLVRLEVREGRYTIEEAGEEEAALVWASRRPAPLEVATPDLAYRDLAAIETIAGTYAPERFGGKGAYLARFLPAIPAEHRVPGFVIPFACLEDYLADNFWGDCTFAEAAWLMRHDEGFRTDSTVRKALLADFQSQVQNGGVSADLVSAIAGRITEVFGSSAAMVRFRSSSNAEDALLFPGAGLYDSYSACADDSFDEDGVGPSRCDEDEAEERRIERALRKVWASLWNFRAFEQRAWHGISEDAVRMGILVTPAFGDEAANGVAVTGSPTDPTDGRYLITVQPGEASVVRPDPGDTPEVDLLAPNTDGTFGIQRVRPTNLLPAGQFVASDVELATLGRALSSLAQSYAPPAPFPPELVRLDVEFKIARDRRVFVKQVRPYCLPGTEKFLRKIEPKTFAFPGRLLVNVASGTAGVLEEHATRSVMRIREPAMTLPLTGEARRQAWVGEVHFRAADGAYSWAGDAEIACVRELRGWVDGYVDFTWTLTQEIARTPEDRLTLRADGVRYRVDLWNAHETEVAWKGFVRASAGPTLVGKYMPCDNPVFAVYRLAVELGQGEYADFLLCAPSSQSVADSAVIGASGLVRGTSFRVEDPLALAVGEGPRPVRSAYLVVVGQPSLPALLIEFRVGEAAPCAVVLDASLARQEERAAASWSRRVFSLPESPRFMRGDVSGDGEIGLADAVCVLQMLFASGAPLACPDSADADDSGSINISDAIVMLRHVFGGARLTGLCDLDATEDALGACAYDSWHCLAAERAQVKGR